MDINAVFENSATVYEGSQLATRSELALFDVPQTDVSTLFSSDYVQHFPLHSVSDNFNPLEFVLSTGTTGYMDLSSSFLLVSCKVVQANGQSTLGTHEVAPSNLFAHAMFSGLEVYLNNVLVFDSNNNYAMTAYIQRLLSSSESDKSNRLRAEFWWPNDEVNKFTKTENDAGFMKRFTLTTSSKTFTMLTHLVANIFTQPRWFPSETEVRIVLWRSQPRFCLDSETTDTTGTCPCRYDITRAVFYTARKVVSPFIIKNHRKMLNANNTMKYPTVETQVKSFAIASGLSSTILDSVVIGKIPKLIILGLVASDAYNGKLASSAFNFEHNNLSDVSVTWNGDTMEHRSIPMSFSKTGSTTEDDYLVALQTLNKTVAIGALSNGINVENFPKGNTLIAIELLPNSGDSLSVNRRGQVRLSLKFREALPSAVTAIVYCQYQSIIEIDKNLNVIFEKK